MDYQPAAACPAIEQFVGDVFPPDALDLAWEIPAFLMLPNTSIQKAMLFCGTGGNGKSTYLAMITAFLGKDNTSALSLHKIEADRFAAARLFGKLANICPDLPSEHLVGTSVFKSITGGDRITGEHKFKESFDFTPFVAPPLFSQSLAESQGQLRGVFRPMDRDPFRASFRGTNQELPRAVLDARLASPGELSGLLNKALGVLPRIREHNGFTKAISVQRAGQEFRTVTDPLAAWLDRNTVLNSQAYVIKARLRAAFSDYLESRDRPLMTETLFGTQFQKLRPDVPSKQRTINGEREWCYIGIGLIGDQQPATRSAQSSQGSSPSNQSRGRRERI